MEPVWVGNRGRLNVAKAMEVFGSQEEALAWLERPALGLEQRRPIGSRLSPRSFTPAVVLNRSPGRVHLGTCATVSSALKPLCAATSRMAHAGSLVEDLLGRLEYGVYT